MSLFLIFNLFYVTILMVINMVDFNELSEYKEIYVIGHANPDADSIFSSYVLSKILKKKGINAKFSVLKDYYTYSYEDEKVIKTYLKEDPVILNNDMTEELNFILVDHNDPEQSIKKGNVLCAIDHHIDSKKILNCYTEEYTSTLLYIYDLFKEEYKFSEYEKKLVAISVLCDSEYLASSRFGIKDKRLFDELNQNIDVRKFREEFFKVTDLNKKIEDIFKDNYKKYSFDTKIINRVNVKAYKESRKYLETFIKHMQNLDGIWLLLWCEYDTSKSYIVVKNNNKITKIAVNYIATSSVLVIKELINKGII